MEVVHGVPARDALKVMAGRGLQWTWGKGCPITGLRHHPYGGKLEPRVGCAMSHYLLWERCAESGEPILVLEHDAVFLREFPYIEFRSVCQINDPRGATRRGDWWSDQMAKRGPGVWPKTWVTRPDQQIPDGLAGNSAYVIKPSTAEHLMSLYHELGVWPNDATMCAQLVDGLQELYPFVTRVESTYSTTSEK